MQNALFSLSAQTSDSTLFMGSGGEIWNWLQNLKEEVSYDLLSKGYLCQDETPGLGESEESKTTSWDIEWRHRAQLEARLREIVSAQDRLLDGTYGKCVECGEQIPDGRLRTDPAADLCLRCQQLVETDVPCNSSGQF